MSAHRVVMHDPVQGHEVMSQSLWPWAKAMLMAGHKLTVLAEELEDDRSLQQNRFYWGVVLKEVSEQAVLNDAHWTADAWHGMFKRVHLGFEVKKELVAGSKRPRIVRRLRSTKGLKVRAMSVYLEKVMAHAASELGVTFSALKWQEYER